METKTSMHRSATEAGELLPNFCDVRVIFMVILVMELLAIVLAMAIPASRMKFWDQLAFISMLLQWIGLINTALLCFARRWLNRLTHAHNLLISFCLMMLVSLCFSLLLLELKAWMGLDDTTSPLGVYFLPRVLVMSAAIYALVLRFFYIQQQWKLNVHANSVSEIQALRARIRPHFLFNSMNTIASLISFKPHLAEKAVVDLADLFRASLRAQNANTLQDELALTCSYLDIEALRLGDRLRVQWDIDETLKEKEIPALCLQPLAENAIYHGIEPLPQGGCISITAKTLGAFMVLSVSNPVHKAAASGHHHGNQMAQENIHRRLQLVYGEQAGFVTNETKTDYTVTLKIPLDTQL
jgi:two-component system sensor histidine kinase AlgZ